MLDDFLNQEEYFLNLFVQKLIDDNKKIIIFSVPYPYQLFLSDQGLFVFPFKDNKGLSGYIQWILYYQLHHVIV